MEVESFPEVGEGPIRLQIILGSTREGRFGEIVARWFQDVATARRDLVAELIDLRDWPLPFFDQPFPPTTGRYSPGARAWADKVDEAEALVFVTPEYNFGYPAVLKNALAHIYREWNDKPVAFVGYGGASGGSRAVQQLRQVVVELQMAPIRNEILLPFARRLFDENGGLADESYNTRARALLDNLVRWARALKTMRSETPVQPSGRERA